MKLLCFGQSWQHLVRPVFYWGLAGLLWLLLFIFFGIRTLRKGDWVMFIIGLFLPLFWLIGALIPSTAETQ